jgi:hypothetical protein
MTISYAHALINLYLKIDQYTSQDSDENNVLQEDEIVLDSLHLISSNYIKVPGMEHMNSTNTVSKLLVENYAAQTEQKNEVQAVINTSVATSKDLALSIIEDSIGPIF